MDAATRGAADLPAAVHVHARAGAPCILGCIGVLAEGARACMHGAPAGSAAKPAWQSAARGRSRACYRQACVASRASVPVDTVGQPDVEVVEDTT